MKKAQVAIYFVWFVAAVIIVLTTAVLAPFGALFTAEMYSAGEDILEQANDSIQGISNATVRESLMGAVGEAKDAAEFNIEVNTDLFQYAWVFVIVLTAIIAFLLSRTIIETRGGGLA